MSIGTNINKIIKLIINIFESEANQAESISLEKMEEKMGLGLIF